jgi:hypothetical protein
MEGRCIYWTMVLIKARALVDDRAIAALVRMV